MAHHRCRLPARAPAGLGRRARVRLRRRRHQRHPGRLGPGGEQAEVHPGPARGDGRLRGRRLREVHRPGRRVHGHLRPGRDPPAQRPVRREAGPRAGGGDRRPDQPQRDGRLLPAGSRPALAVQGRGQRVRPDGDRARAAAQRAGPGHPHRPGRARPDRDHHPVRRAGTGVLGARPTRSRWCRPSIGTDWPVAVARRRRDPAARPRSSTRAARSRSWPARAPAAPGASSRQVADLLGAGVAKPLLGKDVLSDELPYVTGSIGLLGTRPSYEMMKDCDTLLTVGLELPLHPVPARVRPGPRGADRHRRQVHRHALPVRGQPGRRRGRHAARADPAAAGARRTASWREAIEADVARWWEIDGRRGRCRGRPGQPDAAVPRAVGPAARRRDRHRRLRLRRRTGTPGS